jgi:kumamolisin
MTTFARTGIRLPRSSHPVSLTPRQVASAYHYPLNKATGKSYTAGIVELGGGYRDWQIQEYFQRQGLPVPKFTAVYAGVPNRPGDPNGADGEVALDMIVAGAVAPGAAYRIYFCPNTDQGFLAALKQATQECDGVSISWGASENAWSLQVMEEFEAVIKAARAKGAPVFAAAGDTGATDSSGAGVQVDFPASAPSAIGCGGTRLTLDSSGRRASETVWNDSTWFQASATGGGVSKQFPGRQVPDLAGNADPDAGYEIAVDGQPCVVGGTSAVAPLMLGLHALLSELAAGTKFDMANLIATNPTCCYDITVGNNGAYRAGPGRDNVTGWGVPDGSKLLAALTSGIQPPVPPTPGPPSTPPVGKVTLAGTFTGTLTGTFIPAGSSSTNE